MRLLRRPTVALAAVLIVPALNGCSEPAAEGKADVIAISTQDEAVNAAVKEAVRNLPVFWAKFDSKEAGVSDYFVQLAMPTPDGSREDVWAEVIEHSSAEVVARLANEPVSLPGLKLRSVVKAPPDWIVDWTYSKDGKLYGNFTTRVTADRASPEQRAEMETKLAPTPLEAKVD